MLQHAPREKVEMGRRRFYCDTQFVFFLIGSIVFSLLMDDYTINAFATNFLIDQCVYL